MFKVGDKVRCVDNSYLAHIFEIDKIYTIGRIEGNSAYITEKDFYSDLYRFELANETQPVITETQAVELLLSLGYTLSKGAR